MSDESQDYIQLSELVRNAFERRQKVDIAFTQARLAEACGISPADLSRFLRGRRCPSAEFLPKMATELQLDLAEMILLKSIGDCCPSSTDDPEAVAALRNALMQLVERQREEKQRDFLPVQHTVVTLEDWRRNLDIRTVLVGDRRETPPKTIADVLALPGSTGDLMYLSDLHLPHPYRIRSDKILKLASDESIGNLLASDLLIIGSPAVNFAARAANTHAAFRFIAEPELKAQEREFERQLSKIRFDIDALEEFTREGESHKNEAMRELRNMLQGFAKPGFVDPIDYVGPRGVAPKAHNDFGVLTLSLNPWAPGKIAILAAGRSGPGTAAALKLLAADNFRQHPLGGVFKVNISTSAPWELRYEHLRPTWDTHPYTLEQYERAIATPRAKPRSDPPMTREEVTDVSRLISLLRERAPNRSRSADGDAHQ